MSYANGTTHYNLPQTVGTDKRDWFDTNVAFAAVDAALYAAATGQASDAEAITALQQTVAGQATDITGLQTLTGQHTSQIAALNTTVNNLGTEVSDVRQDAEDMITANNEGAAATSTKAYDIGDYFIYNDVLYKATSAIAVGATIVPNTNCVATNVDTELDQIKSELTKKTLDVYVTSDGVKTTSQLYDELNALVDYSKLNPKSILYNPYDVYSLTNYDDNSHYAFFGGTRYSNGNVIIGTVRMVSSGSNYKSVSISMSSDAVSHYDGDSSVPSAGKQIGIIY